MKPLSLITTLFAGTTAAAGIGLGIWGMGGSNSDEEDNTSNLERHISEITEETKQECKNRGLVWIEEGNWSRCGNVNSKGKTVLSGGLTHSEASEELQE